MIYRTLVVCLLLLCVSGCVPESEEVSPEVKEKLLNGGIVFDDDDFDAYDLNKDNILTQSEFDKAIRDSSDQKDIVKYKVGIAKDLDSNKDGKLERQEFHSSIFKLMSNPPKGKSSGKSIELHKFVPLKEK